jgi:hypothetical protein
VVALSKDNMRLAEVPHQLSWQVPSPRQTVTEQTIFGILACMKNTPDIDEKLPAEIARRRLATLFGKIPKASSPRRRRPV